MKFCTRSKTPAIALGKSAARPTVRRIRKTEGQKTVLRMTRPPFAARPTADGEMPETETLLSDKTDSYCGAPVENVSKAPSQALLKSASGTKRKAARSNDYVALV